MNIEGTENDVSNFSFGFLSFSKLESLQQTSDPIDLRSSPLNNQKHTSPVQVMSDAFSDESSESEQSDSTVSDNQKRVGDLIDQYVDLVDSESGDGETTVRTDCNHSSISVRI